MNRYCTRLMRSSVLVALALFVTLFSAYSAPQRKLPHATREVTDMAGRKMVVPTSIRHIYVNKPGTVLMYAVAPDMLALC
jgi:iron complex transport system substrate-binding protein